MFTFVSQKKGALRRKFFLFDGIVVAFILIIAATASAAKPSRVLLIHSFGNATAPARAISVAFEAELGEKMDEPVDLDQVSLDMARYADAAMQDAIVDYLQKRQAKWQPDLVVTMGAPAAIFVASYRDRLFPEAPVLYTSLDRRLLPARALEKNAAYIGQVFNTAGWIEDMLQIAPATKNIEVVIGTTPLERGWQDAFQKTAEPFAGRIKFTYYNDLSFDQMLERVAKLPPDSFIFFLLLRRDALGVAHDSDEALQRLHEVANAPINSIFREQLGLGIVGGRLYQSERIGKEAADVAIRILHGEPTSNFPPVQIDALPPHYDWRELKRWKIHEKLLPAGSTVLFRAPTVWQQYRWWIIGGVSVFVLQGLLIVGLVVNRGRRRRAEGSLVESEGRFQVMADATPVLIWMVGPDKLTTFFNQAWLDFTGRTMEEDRGTGWREVIHPDDLDEVLEQYGTAFDARDPFLIQCRLRRHDGEYRWVTSSGLPRYDAAGGFLGYIGASVDVTELEEKESALHDFEQRVTLAAEAANLGVWEFDPKTRNFWISDSVRKLFHFKPEEQVSFESFMGRIHPDDRPKREEAVQHAVETNGGYNAEFRIVLPDGTIRWISSRARSMPHGASKTLRLVGVSMEVTERKEAEELLHRRRDQIELLSRISLLGEMTASVAHELNQPLSAIMINASTGRRLLERGNASPDSLHEILEDVTADAQRAHDVMQNIRNTIKKGPLVKQVIDLNHLVTSVTHLTHATAAAHECEVTTSLAPNLPKVEGDPIQIQQVLINLLNNAFEAMNAIPPRSRCVEITTRDGGDAVSVSVRDHGVGIPDGAGPRLFEQFFTTKEEGLGMGLAIVRSIVEAHGGRITAENVEAGGARFSFTMPAAK